MTKPLVRVQDGASGSSVGALFDQVSSVLRGHYYDATFRSERLPDLVQRFRERAHRATSADSERAIIREFLCQIPTSHLSLLSRRGKSILDDELFGRARPTFGMQLLEWDGRYFAAMVLDGGPAHAAGIRQWDEVLAINGAPVEGNRSVDARSDDAHLSDELDPPMRLLLVDENLQLRLRVAHRAGSARDLTLTAYPFSALEAARRSPRCFADELVRVGYVHFWYLHGTGVVEVLTAAFNTALAEIDGLVLDLRGRGGSPAVVPKILRLLDEGPERRFEGPVIALADRQTRSGKEILLHELRAHRLGSIVGEPTAGAVMPASFADFDDDVLMFPSARVPVYSDCLELRPISPDVAIPWGGPYSGDRDPILAAGIAEVRRIIRESGKGRVLPERKAIIREVALPPTLPELDEILERMANALGGWATLARDSAMVATGSVQILDTPFAGTFTCRVHEREGYDSTMELAGGIKVINHASEKETWVLGLESGRRMIEGAAALPFRWQSLVAPPIGFSEAFPGALVDGSIAFAGRAAITIALGRDDVQIVHLLVDAGTWLPLGLCYKTPSPLGMLDVEQTYARYRDVEGVQVPDIITSESAGQVVEIRLQDIIRKRREPA